MAETTALDAAHARMGKGGEDEAGQVSFYAALADSPVWVLLKGAPAGDAVEPKLVETPDGPVALAFDREERLAAFAQDGAEQAAMPGRTLVRLLAGQGVGLGLNIGVAPSETVVPAAVIDWLAEVLEQAAYRIQGERPASLSAPEGVAPALLAALDARLARAGGLAERAYLAWVRFDTGREGNMLAITGAAPEAEHAIAQAVSEGLRLAGADALDMAFFESGDPIIERLERVALRFDLSQPAAPVAASRPAPGSDPDKPPRLR